MLFSAFTTCVAFEKDQVCSIVLGAIAAPWGFQDMVMEDLASTWEQDFAIRRRARQTRQLVRWPDPKTVGVPSLILGMHTFILQSFKCLTQQDM